MANIKDLEEKLGVVVFAKDDKGKNFYIPSFDNWVKDSKIPFIVENKDIILKGEKDNGKV